MTVTRAFRMRGRCSRIARSGSAQLRFVTRVVFEPAEGSELIGSVAPRLVLERAGGGQAAIPVATGRPSVVTFLASWCPPCHDEAATLATVAAFAAGGIDRVLVAVEDDPVTVADAYGSVPIPVLVDPYGAAFAAYKGFGLPLTVFIDGAGVIRSVVHGPLDEVSIEAGLDAIEPFARFYSEPSGSPIPIQAEPAASLAG